MKHLLIIAAALPGLALAAPPRDPAALRDAALGDDLAWTIVSDLTTEIGPRPAGTPTEAKARDWAVARLKALGFAHVHVEPFTVGGWVRGAETGEIVGAHAQRLALTALGNSGATAAEGLTAPVVMFDGLEALKAAPDGSLRGKIAFVTHRMAATQDGSSYGAFGPIRFTGPSVAAQKGAVAIVIRSVGSDHNRLPHAGVTNFPAGVTPIPAAALSVPDAEQIERLVALGAVSLHLTLTPTQVGPRQSGDVIAEVPGRDPKAGIVLIGGHLDSWDLGTGAIDDGAGVAITTAAAKRMLDGPRPRRTIRLAWFGSEEIGGAANGRDAYQDAHMGEVHALAAESDLGADRVWRLDVKLPERAAAVKARLAAALAPLGIAPSMTVPQGGSDVGATIEAGASGIDLRQDATRYFDTHHSANDTLDRIDRTQLRQNVAAWTAMLAIVADAPETLGQEAGTPAARP